MKRIISIMVSVLFAVSMQQAQDYALDTAWSHMTEEQRYDADIEYKARAVRMTVEDFDLMSRVVEAESDRGYSLEGRVLIALTIFNRVNSSEFPNNVHDVCYQSGQFQVVYEGTIWNVGRTGLSDWAIIEASRRINSGEYPNVMYFNAHNYSYGTPYGYVDGNYFVTC